MAKFFKDRPMPDRVRGVLMYTSAITIVAGFVSGAVVIKAAPLGPMVPTTVQVVMKPTTPSIYQLRIRDPFVVPVTSASGPQSVVGPNGLPVPGAVPQLGQLGVPNPDGSMPVGTPVGGQMATYTLQATLLGNPSIAEFQSGDDVQLLKVGDMLGDRKIAEIAKTQVVFVDGSRISLKAADDTSTTPAQPANSIVPVTTPPAQTSTQTATPLPNASQPGQPAPVNQ